MTASRSHEEEVSRTVQENHRLVEFAVSRYLERHPLEGVERDDLVSWGMLGLYHAARAWDARRGLAFSTLAVIAIERMIARGVRAERRGRLPAATLSLDVLVSEENEASGERHLDHLPDASDSVEEQILQRETEWTLRRAVAELSPEQQWVLQQRYYEQRTLQEIAAVTGTSRQAIYFREQTSLRALRRKLSAAPQAIGESHRRRRSRVTAGSRPPRGTTPTPAR